MVKTFSVQPYTEDTWLFDHRPNAIVPVIPMMGFVRYVALLTQDAFPGKVVRRVGPLFIMGFFGSDERMDITGEVKVVSATQAKVFLQGRIEGQEWKTIVHADVEVADALEPASFEMPEVKGRIVNFPYYEIQAHQSEFRRAERVVLGAEECSVEIDAGVPERFMDYRPFMLDATLHGIPHYYLSELIPDFDPEMGCAPMALNEITFYSTPPTHGRLDAYLRVVDKDPKKYVKFEVFCVSEGRLWAHYQVTHAVLHRVIGVKSFRGLRELFVNRVPHQLGSFSCDEGDGRYLTHYVFKCANAVPGTLKRLMHLELGDLKILEEIVIKEAFAYDIGVHPEEIRVLGGGSAYYKSKPGQWRRYDTKRDEEGIRAWRKY